MKGQTIRDRVFSHLIIDADTGCLLWTGGRAGSGYGSISKDGKKFYVHRLMYEWFIGPIPDGMEIDHLCRIRHCAAPAHLEAVAHSENLRRGAGSHNAVKTHCPRGHLYDEANTYRIRDRRLCRQCQRDRLRQRAR